ncbi:TetR/AcrR family transcriptional regulator [soil metagenome]
MAGTRERIVAATTELFRRRGFNGTSLKEITTTAHAPTGSLYHFFPDGKTQLAEAVITESGAAYQQLYELIADAAADPVQAIGDFFDGAADVLEQTDFIDICPIGTVAREIASTDETLRIASDGVFAGWIEASASRLRAAGLSVTQADELSATLVAAVEGGFILARTRRDSDVLRGIGRQMQTLVSASLAATATAGQAR